MRAVFLHTTPSDRLPWWWEEIRRDRQLCDLDYVPLKFRGKRSKQVTSIELPFYMLRLLWTLLRLRGKYDYVFTTECDLNGLGIAFWQSLFFMRRPRHVILQFIMREKTPSLASRAKYALMTFMFRSLHRAVCSSRSEAAYYRDVFGWTSETAQFVPLLTSPECVEHGDPGADQSYVMAAGRVFRDYPTAIQAVKGTPLKLVIVGGAGVTRQLQGDEQVQILEELPQAEFIKLARHALAIVVPLVDKRISTGQTVILQAMAMGKLVIATRTAGTEDYIDHMVDGVLVPPGDVEALRHAMGAAADVELRRQIGNQARARMVKGHMPHHYSAAIRGALRRPKTASCDPVKSHA